MKMQTLAMSILAGTTLALAQPAFAQKAPTTPAPAESPAGTQKLDSADRDFLENAAQAGHLEVEGSKLAATKAKSADVKAFAEKMIADHGKVGQELDALAKSKGYTPPTEPSMMQRAKLKTLDVRDESFDKAYADSIGVSAHEDAVELFTKASKEAKDADVKAFAAKTLPALQEHLNMGRELQKKVGDSAK
ncbi:Predicted outer membrane protein [Bordetella ansorpii]|uniref:Predicted outer membrane protein n=1 Tax=Bordetella ansorpii TaxID=288768 RepID=A0A157Q506_9BORD|nr:DUF4142 domain-containing protein [Bordetella ansorpii]SAI40962.1 Predicted outer membrane protein [Bordetella ansorpii]